MRNRFVLAAIAMATAASLAMPALAQQSGRMSGLQLDGDQPIEIESDRLEVRDNEGIAIFSGNVSVVQGETLLKSGRMVVHYANQGGGEGEGGGGSPGASSDIERLEVEDQVYVRTQSQVATGDRGTFDMRTDQLTLSGDEVVLTEGENVIVGCKLTVQMSSGVAQLDGCGDSGGTGRVRMLLQPGSQNP